MMFRPFVLDKDIDVAEPADARSQQTPCCALPEAIADPKLRRQRSGPQREPVLRVRCCAGMHSSRALQLAGISTFRPRFVETTPSRH
jgi:hypothetical protein